MGYPDKKRIFYSLLNTTIISSIAFILTSCQETPKYDKDSQAAFTQEKSLKEILAEYKGQESKKGKVAQGIECMLAGEYDDAATHFNHVLLKDPTNSTVHLLNGINYQLKAAGGDVTQLDIAQAGLVQSLKFNPTSSLTLLQLGRIKKTKKDYAGAQEDLAQALLIDSQNKEALYELATTSYLMGDLKTAYAIMKQYLNTSSSASPEVLHSASIIFAACGDTKASRETLDLLKSMKGQDFRSAEVQRRTQDWKKLYDQGFITLAQAAPAESGPDVLATAPDLTADPNATAGEAVAPGATSPTVTNPIMVVIDALVMRSSEKDGSNKGSNILDKFSITLEPGNHYKARAHGAAANGGNGADFSGVPIFPTTTGLSGATIAAGGQNPFSVSRLFTQGVSFGSVQYSLNIANVSRQSIQVLDRPSVTTILGQKGEFFSGSEFALGLSGQFGGNVTKTPVGITLVVTPTIYDQATDIVTLDIKMYGSLLGIEGLAKDATTSFSEFEVSRVFTTVNMKMGETLMLGGIQTRTDQQTKSGFPILQDLPGIQYFFSNQAVNSDRKAVTFLLTPRLAADAKKLTQMAFTNEVYKNRRALTELEKRNKDWFSKPYTNWTTIYKGVETLYQEVRLGDIADIKWEQDKSLDSTLSEIKSFFYY